MLNLDLNFEQILMLLPLLAINLGLTIVCIFRIVKEGVSNLNKTGWILIVAFTNLIGPIIFLIVGRKKDSYDTCD